MAKQRQVVSVHLDIAALVWATRGLNSEADWAIWGRSFVEALATQSPDKNQFAAQLIGDVIDFRAKEAERVRELREQSVQERVHTERKKVRQKESKTSKPPAAREKNLIWDEVVNLFFADGVPPSKAAWIGKIVKDLNALQATPEQIRTRTEAMRRTDWGRTATPEALVKHWSTFADRPSAPPPKAPQNAYREGEYNPDWEGMP